MRKLDTVIVSDCTGVILLFKKFLAQLQYSENNNIRVVSNIQILQFTDKCRLWPHRARKSGVSHHQAE